MTTATIITYYPWVMIFMMCIICVAISANGGNKKDMFFGCILWLCVNFVCSVGAKNLF